MPPTPPADRSSGRENDDRDGHTASNFDRRTFLGTGVAAVGALAVGGSTLGAAASTADAFEPSGSLKIDGLSEVVVDDSGTVAFGALREGFVAVDVSDPANPTELTRVTEILPDAPDGPVTDIYDVKYDAGKLLVAGPRAAPGRGDTAGFEVFDVSDPENPERLAGTTHRHGAHNSYIEGDAVYITGSGAMNEPLVIYSATGDAEELARWSVVDANPRWGDVSRNLRPCHDVTVQDGVAYAAYWDAGTWMLDVSDPSNPEPIAKVGGLTPDTVGEPPERNPGLPPRLRELPGNSHYVQPSTDGTLLGVGKEAWDDDDTKDHDGGPGGVEIWDISDPENAERLTILAPPGEGNTSHNFGWADRRLYTSWYGGGVKVYDLSDPAAPQLLGKWADEETTSMWTAKPTADGFVASSYADPRKDREELFEGIGAKLLTFPSPGTDGASAAETMTPRPTPKPESDGGTGTTSTDGTTQTTADATTKDTTTTADGNSDGTTATAGGGTTSDDETTTEGQPQPGFGVLATVSGLGLAAWGMARRLGDDEE